MSNKNQGVFVSWINYHGRSQGFIDNLDMTPIYIKKIMFISKILLPVRYLMNSIETLFRLLIERPTGIIVMSPPIFAVISVYIYALLTRTNFVVDNHSGAFESGKWKWSVPILRFICQKADFVLVTNIAHFELVKSWNSRPIIVGNPPPVIPKIVQEYSRELSLPSLSVAVVNTYSKNEALDEIVHAARLCVDITFYVTGDIRKARDQILNELPANVILTGWLDDNEFWMLLKKSNIVLTLINQENTILQGGWEAMYLGQPLITSNTTALRNYFYKGAVFVDNQGESISAAICYALKNETELRARMKELALQRIHEWNANVEIWRELICPNLQELAD